VVTSTPAVKAPASVGWRSTSAAVDEVATTGSDAKDGELDGAPRVVVVGANGVVLVVVVLALVLALVVVVLLVLVLVVADDDELVVVVRILAAGKRASRTERPATQHSP
jgi:hypothetical protein